MVSVPKEYYLISEAGRGVTARVYFCLPAPQVQFLAKHGPLTPDSLGFDGLRRSIVAVKVSPSKPLIGREYTALKAIQNCTVLNADAMRRHFLEVKSVGAFGGFGTAQSCVAFEAIDSPITLADVVQECSDEVKIPIPLVYHFFLSLMPALLFLKDGVKWAHNDIKEDNIMCRVYEGSPFDLPEFVFVDFGMAYSIEAVKDDSGDWKNLLGLLRMLAEHAEPSDDQQWLGFKRMLDGEAHRTRWQVDDEVDKIWRTWRDVAVAARSKRKMGEMSRVDDMFERMAQRKGRVTDEIVVKAIEN
ncbi:hypothetical protein OPT61_g7724 [Boeremia exigua]|uniref:Uncharacterized protein n=1 Tax=Boeremia exigua TaxID=749465 RepID=A0ACC2I131_9PLEO|nr:hypothetical protein OPT61_g7724 [Boeremia exigua]